MQKISTLIGLIIIILWAIVALGGALTYSHFAIKDLESKSVTGLINQTTIDQTAGWKTYEWKFYKNIISFKYPANWVVEKEYYLTPAQQITGESPNNIGLFIYPKNNKLDNIHIAGRQNSCDKSQKHTKCISNEAYDVIFTDSKNAEILKIFEQMLSTFKFIAPVDQTSTPRIDSIAPASGPKGTTVEIRGTELSGFEGDLDVYFERADGKRVMLTDTFGDYAKTQDKLIKVKVTEPCQQGEKVIGRYSGIETECDYIELAPGIYKVYAEPWGKKTNTVTFEITDN